MSASVKVRLPSEFTKTRSYCWLKNVNPNGNAHLAGVVVGQRERVAERLQEAIRRLFGVVAAARIRRESHRHVRKVEGVGPRHQIARIVQHRDLSGVLRRRLERRHSSRPPRDSHAVLPQSVEMPPARIGIEASRLGGGGGPKRAAEAAARALPRQRRPAQGSMNCALRTGELCGNARNVAPPRIAAARPPAYRFICPTGYRLPATS